MFINVNLSAPIGAMAFLGTAFLLLLAAALLTQSSEEDLAGAGECLWSPSCWRRPISESCSSSPPRVTNNFSHAARKNTSARSIATSACSIERMLP